MQSFVKIKPSRNDKITLSSNDIGKPCLSCEFFTSLICLLMLFAKNKIQIYSIVSMQKSQVYLQKGPFESSCNLGPLSDRHKNAIPMAFCWRSGFNGVLLTV